MTEEEKKAIKYFKALDKLTFEPYLSILLNLIEKQQKEIEVLREENFDTIYMKAIADYKSKIRKILQIEGNADIETYLKIIVAENNRLEDIEDDRDCNYISKDKIREIIEKHYPDVAISKLYELLEV